MKTKLMLLLVVISTLAIAQQNIRQSGALKENLIVNAPVREDSLYSEKMIVVDKGTIFSPSQSYKVVAGEKIILNQGIISAPEKGFKHEFLVRPSKYISDKPVTDSKPSTGNVADHSFKVTNSNAQLSLKDDIRTMLVEPNPGSGTFNIVLHGGSNNLKRMIIFNTMGEVVYSDSFSEKEKYQLDITKEPAGIYVIIIYESSLVYQSKIIKE